MLQIRNILRAHARPSFLRTGARQNHTAPSTVRYVRFKRPWARPFFTKVFLYGTAFFLWNSFVFGRIEIKRAVDEPSKSQSIEDTPSQRTGAGIDDLEKDEVEEEDDDTPLFIPLTWSQMQEGELYNKSDPEWQRFVEMSKDKKKLQELRTELATIVLKTASGQLSPLLGSPLSLTGFWLVHQFPSRAPPTYVRSGLEFTENGVSWATRSIEPELGDRLQLLMNPLHVALAIKDAYMVLFRRQMARFKNPQDQPDQQVDLVELLTGNRAMSKMEGLGPLNHHEQRTLQSPGSEPHAESASSRASNEPDLHPSPILSSLQRLPLPNLGPGSDLHLASVAFKLRLNEYQAKSPRTPRRGTFVISGPVGIKGPNGFCRFDVNGEYDPVKPGWRTVEISLKDVIPRKQQALGDQS